MANLDIVIYRCIACTNRKISKRTSEIGGLKIKLHHRFDKLQDEVDVLVTAFFYHRACRSRLLQGGPRCEVMVCRSGLGTDG